MAFGRGHGTAPAAEVPCPQQHGDPVGAGSPSSALRRVLIAAALLLAAWALLTARASSAQADEVPPAGGTSALTAPTGPPAAASQASRNDDPPSGCRAAGARCGRRAGTSSTSTSSTRSDQTSGSRHRYHAEQQHSIDPATASEPAAASEPAVIAGQTGEAVENAADVAPTSQDVPDPRPTTEQTSAPRQVTEPTAGTGPAHPTYHDSHRRHHGDQKSAELSQGGRTSPDATQAPPASRGDPQGHGTGDADTVDSQRPGDGPSGAATPEGRPPATPCAGQGDASAPDPPAGKCPAAILDPKAIQDPKAPKDTKPAHDPKAAPAARASSDPKTTPATTTPVVPIAHRAPAPAPARSILLMAVDASPALLAFDRPAGPSSLDQPVPPPPDIGRAPATPVRPHLAHRDPPLTPRPDDPDPTSTPRLASTPVPPRTGSAGSNTSDGGAPMAAALLGGQPPLETAYAFVRFTDGFGAVAGDADDPAVTPD